MKYIYENKIYIVPDAEVDELVKQLNISIAEACELYLTVLNLAIVYQEKGERKMEENKGHIHCPANAWDCPYYDANGHCMMYPDSDPNEECDDFYYFWGEMATKKDYVDYDNE